MAEQASLFFFVNEPRSSNRTSFTRGFDLAGYSRIMSPVFSSANPPNSILCRASLSRYQARVHDGVHTRNAHVTIEELE